MSLTIKNSISSYTKTFNEELISGYTCIGSYEDKPKNRIYYFLHSEDDEGLSGKYDCIVEYDQFNNSSTIVYQDGRRGSDGHTENVLNFSKSHLITGINKVEDTLYFTDNLNRPRKINVEKAKVNEARINSAPRFQGSLKEMGGDSFPTVLSDSSIDGSPNTGGFFLKKARVFSKKGETSTTNSILVGVDNNNPFLKNDNLYLQQSGVFDFSTLVYNGYSKVRGVVKNAVNRGSVSFFTNSKVVTSPLGFNPDLNAGDYICVVLSQAIPVEEGSGTTENVRVPYFYEVEEIVSSTEIRTAALWHTSGVSLSSSAFKLSTWNTSLNTNNAIITDSPASDVNSSGGRIFYADPDDAYSPLISFGTRADKIKYFDALSHQPRYRPKFDFSKNSSTLNHLLGKFFQFRYRYVYKDGSVSAYSGISDVANQDAYAVARTNTDNNAMNAFLSNVIHVNYSDDVSTIDKIEVVARDGNNGEFFLISTIKNDFIKYLKKRKNEALIVSPGLYFGGPNQTDVAFSRLRFTNDSVYPFADPVELGKLQDHLPKKAKAQTILPKNRIAYGNVVDGYDNTDIYCNMKFETSDFINSTEEALPVDLIVSAAGGPSSETKIQIGIDLGALTAVVGSPGAKNISIDIKWSKFLFQNHGLPIGGPYGSISPKSGHFTYEGILYNPQDIDEIASFVVNDINLNNSGEIKVGGFKVKSVSGFDSAKLKIKKRKFN